MITADPNPKTTARSGLFFSFFASLAFALVAALAVPGRAFAQPAVPTDLGSGTNAHGVANGFVAGASNGQAFVWSAATQTKQFIAPSGSTFSVATGVNSQGEVAGVYGDAASNTTKVFYWKSGTGFVLINATIANYSESPVRIGENGVVGGTDINARVFRWTQAGGLQDLGAIAGGGGAYDTHVTAINSRGDIVGNSGRGSAGYARSFVAWGNASTLTILASPGDYTPRGVHHMHNVNIQINGINDSGVIVGAYWDFQYIPDWGMDGVHKSHSFRWTSAGGFTNLGNLGGSTNSATAINNLGTIVGIATLPTGVFAPWIYGASTGSLTQMAGVNAGSGFIPTGINDDGYVAASSNAQMFSVLWKDGVSTTITPSFAPQYNGQPGNPLLKGSTLASNGLDGGWNTHAWTLALPSAPPPPPTQTLTILGGSGNVGEFAANVEYYNPATGNWQPAYLAGGSHPWGNITGTNQWINYIPSLNSDPGVSSVRLNPTWYLYRVRFTVPADALDPTMTFSIKADNWAQVAINGVSTAPATATPPWSQVKANGVSVGLAIEGQANNFNADAIFSQALVAGENTITLNVGDWGGLNGFNFRIDLTVKSAQPLEIVPVDTDTTPPVILSPGDITAEATGPLGAAVSFTATAVDNIDGPVSVIAAPPSGSTFSLGTTAVGLAAADAAGNTATDSFDVTVVDTTAPSIAPTFTVTEEATGPSGAVVSFSVTAVDLVDGPVAVIASPVSGSTFALGSTTVGLAAADSRQNTATSSFVVKVRDTTAPTLTLPASITVEATSAAGAAASFSASATDLVSGSLPVSLSPASGSTFALGSSTVAASAVDAAGNSASGSFTVTVQDTTAPVLTVPANLIVEATSPAGAAVSFAASASDLVSGAVTVIASKASGSTFALGTTTVSLSATDAAGNTATGSFTVTVRDTTAPVITAASTNAPTLWPPNHKMVAVTVSATASDAVGPVAFRIVSATSNEPDNGLGDGDTANDIVITGNMTLNLRAERSGKGNGRIYTITVEAKDAAGNSSTRTVTVSVPKNQNGK